MRKFAEAFYRSPAWRNCRAAYISSVGGLCERCLQRGLIRAGDTVHHIRELSPDNIDDPDVTLNWDNLICLCRDCHADVHRKVERRFRVDEFGRVTTDATPLVTDSPPV